MATVTLTSAVAGQVCTAAFYNANQNAIINQVNGNIDSTNLAALAVTGPKIATGAVSGPKIAMGSDAQGDILFRGAANYQRLGAGTAGQVLVTGGAGANPAWAYSGVMQVVNVQTGTFAKASTAIPWDNTIPQNTEGTEYMTLAITPKSATSKLLITVTVCGCDGGRRTIAALFQDTTADALATAGYVDGTADFPKTITFSHYMTSGTTSATTFKVRVGTDTGGAFYFNGDSSGGGTGVFNGTQPSSITITELA